MSQQNKKLRPLIMDVKVPSPKSLAEYEKTIKEKLTPGKLKELERNNLILQNLRQSS